MMFLFAFVLFMGWPLGFVEPCEYQCFCFLTRMRPDLIGVILRV